MSIATELQNYADGLDDAYDAVNDMSGIIPQHKNMNNLDQAIRTIPQNTGTTYTAGTGIDITSDVISVDNTTVPFFSDLATVATTGDYGDLLNTPTIPAAQVNSDWDANSGVAQILNKPSLATVATSGSYSDLSNKPTIPTSTSDLVNDGSDGTSTYVEADDLATIATSGSYNDLLNTPTIPTKTSDLTNDGSDNTSVYVEADELATVATSGLYSDLSGAPTIPPEPLIIYTSAAIGNAFQTYSDDNLTVVITGAQIGAAFKAGRQIILTTDTILEPTATIVAFTEGPEDMFTCVVDNTTYRYGYKSAQSKWVAVSRTVNDGTLTIQHNGTTVQTFTANQSTNVTANIETIYADTIAPATPVAPITGDMLDFTSAAGSAVMKTITDSYGRTGIYFADGTLITYRKVQYVGPINTAWGSLYTGHTTDYYKFAPTGGADFIAEPNVQVTLLNNSASGSCWMGAWENSVQIVGGGWAIPAGALCFIRASAYVPNITLNLYIQAIGKWK